MNNYCHNSDTQLHGSRKEKFSNYGFVLRDTMNYWQIDTGAGDGSKYNGDSCLRSQYLAVHSQIGRCRSRAGTTNETAEHAYYLQPRCS